jgi:hypothetical protein
VADIDLIRESDTSCTIRLQPLEANQDLSLERWSLGACAPVVEEALGVQFKVLGA